jgi:hypothetical protein
MNKKSPPVSPKIPAHAPTLPAVKALPTHRQIAIEAEVLWRQRGCPTGDDVQIWLDAERQLHHVPAISRDKLERLALRNPLSRMDMNSDDVMGELEELFPSPETPVSTAL